eukprot:CAMPEP_0196574060 /NCGR_PEP_ID=MMETSP1081-20130531/3842_1 /TAXON_ID=36882 /ORGANISM="Pyramimonas amylifera, Strain CCMP720" /LENGTH=395 /DNA_ID=CAMNT_0041891959 /DNA_START=113 /DNA_END=1300 /DNA_ORIENTATION=+
MSPKPKETIRPPTPATNETEIALKALDALPARRPSKKQANPTKSKAKSTVGAAQSASHPLCVNTLKGHNDDITGLAMSAEGTCLHLASSCADSTVRVYKLDDVAAKSCHIVRINLEHEKAVAVAFGSSPSEVVVAACPGAVSAGSRLCKYIIPSKPGAAPELKWKVDKAHGNFDILSLAASKTLALSCSNYETNLGIWSIDSGKLIEKVNTNQLVNNSASISPDGRFFAAATFTADVKVWELLQHKVTDPVKCTRVMVLQGHKGAVTSVAFSADSTKMVTASKDGFLILWNINVRYQLSEDPKILLRTPCVMTGGHYSKIALSPSGLLAAVVAPANTTLHFLLPHNGEVVEEVLLAHSSEITCFVWAPIPAFEGNHEVLATAGGDRKLKLWKSPL